MYGGEGDRRECEGSERHFPFRISCTGPKLVLRKAVEILERKIAAFTVTHSPSLTVTITLLIKRQIVTVSEGSAERKRGCD